MNEAKVRVFLQREKDRMEDMLDKLAESDKQLQQQVMQNATHRKELMARVNQIDACLEDEQDDE